ncbi:MAG: SdpI family protein [Nanoarchaeota archaeon]|nr:SdpI family protein [Nanoarchaeota archaeon]MBU0977641.1 SdpI family protein [Nanoarchaeota archaeon]
MRATINVAFALIIVSFLIGVYLYPQMPVRMDSHWNAAGEVNGHASRFMGLFLLPIISLVLLVLLVLIPRIDPKKENIRAFRKEYDWLIFVIIAFLFYVYFLSVLWNLGARFNFSLMLLPAFTILFLFMAFVLGKAKPNWFIGIRTPWTLSSEKVWYKTHKMGAKMFKAVALVSLLGFIFPLRAIWFVIIPVLIVVAYLIVYSYVVYKREHVKKAAR